MVRTGSKSKRMRFGARGGLSQTLLSAFMSLTVVVVIILTGVSIWNGRRVVENQVVAHFTSVAELKKMRVEIWLEERQAFLRASANSLIFADAVASLIDSESGTSEYRLHFERLQQHLKGELNVGQPFVELFILNKQGRVVVSTENQNVNKLHPLDAFFIQGLLKPYVEAPFYDRVAGEMIVVLSQPIEYEQQTIGVIVGRLKLTELQEIMQERAGLGETGETYLVNRDRMMVTASRFSGEVEDERLDTLGIENALARSSDYAMYRNYRGEPVVGVYRWLPDLQVALLAEREQREAFAGVRGMIIWNLGVGAAVVILAAIASGTITRLIAEPITRLTSAATMLADGYLEQRVEIERSDEIGTLAQAFNMMAGQLDDLFKGLEQRVEMRTRELAAANKKMEQQMVQLGTAAQISRAASSVLDIDELLALVVDLVRKRLELYYVGIFLLDAENRYAVLRAGTGEAGRTMLEREHKLEVGGESMIGSCVADKEARIALDVGQEAVRFDNPLLPATRSELALPLISRGRAIGAMTVQSTKEAAFSETDISVLQTMADQVANALENARLYEEAQRRVSEVTALHQQYLKEAWDEFLPARETTGYERRGDRRLPLGNIVLPEIRETIKQKRTRALASDNYAELVAPIALRGQVVGALGVQDPEGAREWTEDDIALVESVSLQAGLAIENARLFNEAQESLREVMELNRRFIEEEWEKFLPTQQKRHYEFGFTGVSELDEDQPMFEVDRALTQEQIVSDGGTDAKSAIVAPIVLRGQTIGALGLHETERAREWTEDEKALIAAVSEEMAIAVENARLLAETQRRAIELQEMDKLRSQFLANMSHELRTPLNAIIGFSRVILKGIDGPLTEFQEADLNSIYNNGQHLLGLINDILDMSRIEAGKMELVFEPTDLNQIIDGVMSTAKGLVKDKPNVELLEDIQENIPIIRADRTRIRQVILNFLSNAAKFTEEGHIKLSTWTDDEFVYIGVEDTGIGIAEEDQAKVFEEFRQVDGSSTRKAGGTGLGMPISKHFVEMHGGRMWLESERGKGSTFYFCLPLRQKVEIDDPELAAVEIDPERKLVLAVEDEAGVVAMYQRYLEKHDYQVVGVGEGERALPWARELMPRAILLDVELPDKDGWTVLEEMKKARETQQTPIIVCTVVDEEAKALSMGATGYLAKPILEDDLVGILDKALNKL